MTTITVPIDSGARERFEAYKRGQYIPPPKTASANVSDKQWDSFAALLAREMKKREENNNAGMRK
ncbi:MAG: hypothetical protein QM689_12565 [Oscillospiraceae bacterium]